jgi:hypothetical protein
MSISTIKRVSFAGDGIHPNEAGQLLMAELVLKGLGYPRSPAGEYFVLPRGEKSAILAPTFGQNRHVLAQADSFIFKDLRFPLEESGANGARTRNLLRDREAL